MPCESVSQLGLRGQLGSEGKLGVRHIGSLDGEYVDQTFSWVSFQSISRVSCLV